MLLFQSTVSRRLLVALGLALCTLPGCGGGSGSNSPVRSTAFPIIPPQSLTESFPEFTVLPPPNLSGVPAFPPPGPEPFRLQAPIDQTKPLTVTSNSIPLVLGKDYSIDATFPDTVYVTYLPPTNSTLTVNYISLTTVKQVFFTNTATQTRFSLAHPVDTNHPIRIQIIQSPSNTPFVTLTAQQYTIDPKNPTLLKLVQPPQIASTISVVYVPKTP